MDAITEFFSELERRGHVPLLDQATGAIRFEIIDDSGAPSYRTVTIDHGDVRVSSDPAPAGCVVTARRDTLEAVCTGTANPMAAFLRGELCVTGDVELLVLFQRLFPRRTPAEARS